MSVLSAPYFHAEAAALAELEASLWPHGPVCPRCGGTDRITTVKGGRMGLRRCGPCQRQFTVTVGTVFESSHVALNFWLQAVCLMCSSEKGMSYIGRKPNMPKHRGTAHKHAVLTLVKRGGSARSFHVDGTKAADLLPIIEANTPRRLR